MDRKSQACLLLLAFLALLPAAGHAAGDVGAAKSLVAEARGLWAQGKCSEACGKLEAALQKAPGYPPAEGLLAVALQAQNQPEKALEHYWAVQRGSFPPFPPEVDPKQVKERELLVQCESLLALLTNRERLARQLTPFLPDPALAVIARQHSEEMRDRNYFTHESPTPELRTIVERFEHGMPPGAEYLSLAENLARRWAEGRYSLTPAAMANTHHDWMLSPHHCENILSTQVTNIGVGIAVNAAGDYWATQFFARYTT